MIYKKINYINWKEEAIKKVLNEEDMRAKLDSVKATRTLTKSRTKRVEFDELHYGLDIHGDYLELYLFEDGKYHIYSNNLVDPNKNNNEDIGEVDKLFDNKFKELNGLSLRLAYGFTDKTLKRCIPKQFYYIEPKYIDKLVKASSIDASSQYFSGCLGKLPDSHTMIRLKGRIEPNEEYPFAFYASGHCAEYGVFDTHNWRNSKFHNNLFRWDKKEPWPFRPLKDEDEETILMKASNYTMDSTINYFYDIKNSFEKDTPEYQNAKNIILKIMGCWHRKDKDKKRIKPYDSHDSYKLAHIVAIAIARGNQKILNKIDEIGSFNVIHICVDGIVYLGNTVYGQEKSELGKFNQEFVGADFKMRDINVYCAKYENGTKFKHASYDLLNGKEIDETQDFNIEDLYKLERTEKLGDVYGKEI